LDLVIQQPPGTMTELSEFVVGGHYEVKRPVVLRIGEALDSELVAEFMPGTRFTILGLGSSNRRRANVVIESEGCHVTVPCSGWLSMMTKEKTMLIGMIRDLEPCSCSHCKFTPISSKVRALFEASREGNLERVMELTKKQGVIFPLLSSTDNYGKTALSYAAAFGRDNVVEYLLSKPDVDVNATDDLKKHALHHACFKSRVAQGQQCVIIARLINARAHLESPDHKGCTAMMYAAANGREAVVLSLMEGNGQVNTKDSEGHTALDFAVRSGQQPIVNLLLSHGGVRGATETEEEELEEAEEEEEASTSAPDTESEAETAASDE